MFKGHHMTAAAVVNAMSGYRHCVNITKDKDKNDESKIMIKWIRTRIKLSTFQDLSKVWDETEHDPIISKFILYASNKSLFATVDQSPTNDKLVLTLNAPPPPGPGRREVAYFIRAEGNELSPDNIDDHLLFGSVAMDQTASSVLNIMEKVFYPNIFYTTSWNDSCKRELMGLYHRFMASLTESANDENGRTTLYLPFRNDMQSNLHGFGSVKKFSVDDKEWIQQLEGIAIHWMRQIKGVLNSHDHEISSETKGPIEEIEYWESRAQDLSSILDQLQSDDVQNIVSILNQVDSKYAKPVTNLKDMINTGLKEAENVVKFLSILQDPCKRLSRLEPDEVPSLLPELMNCTRLIYFHSSNYNSYERISDLLRRISNEIIRQCSKFISLHEVFYGNLDGAIKVLMMCTECVKLWKDMYNRTTITVNKHIGNHKKWQQNDASIFAEIDAFLQRCEDLIDVCRGRTQFVSMLCGGDDNDEKSCSAVARKIFKGMNGAEVERTLTAVTTAFRSQLDKLDHLDYNILDARASQWHNDYNSFKAAMKELDVAIINIINKAFDDIKVVETAVHMLISFREIASRPAIQLCVSKKSHDVRMLFKRQCLSIRQEFDDFHRKPPLRMNEPRFAGAALWAKALSNTIKNGWNLIHNSTETRVSDIDELEIFVKDMKSALHAYQSQKYSDWLCTISNMDLHNFQDRLNRPLLIKGDTKDKQIFFSISSNFDCDIIAIFSESHFWDKLHMDEFNTPNSILGICHQREVLRLMRERVMILVRSYNSLIDDLSGISELYSTHLKGLEKRLYPGFTNLTWSTRQTVIDRFVQISVHQIREVHCEVKIFHERMRVVKSQCQLLANTTLIQVDRNILYRGKEFEDLQQKHRSESKKQLIACYQRIKSEMKHIYHQFCNRPSDVLIAWRNCVADIDNQILQALLKSVKTSLYTFSNAVDGESFAGDSHPLFSTTAILKNGTLECRPSMIDITNAVNIVAKEMIGVTKSIDRLSMQKELSEHNTQVASFYEEISSDNNVLDIIVHIMSCVASSVASVAENLLVFETYRSLWDIDKESFLRRYSKSKTKQTSFETDIEMDINKYQSLISSIQKERSSIVVDFIQLNFSSLKSLLVTHSVDFREKLLDLLKKHTMVTVDSLLKNINENINELIKPIISIEDLSNMSTLVDVLEKKSAENDNVFEHLEKAFSILGRFEKERTNKSNEEILKQLQSKHNLLQENISDAKVKISSAKVVIKGEFHNKISNHQDEMIKLCNKVDDAFTSEAASADKVTSAWIKSVKDDIDMLKTREKELIKGTDYFGDVFGIDSLDNQQLECAEAKLSIMENTLDDCHSWQTAFDQWQALN